MKIATLTAILTLGLASAALANAVPQLSIADPLYSQIVKSGENNSQVTVMRDAAGKTVVLHLGDMAAPYSATLAPAAKTPGTALKAAAGLAPKKAQPKKGRRMPRRAVEQLHHVQAHKTGAW